MTTAKPASVEPNHPRLAELLHQSTEVDRQAREVAGELTREQLLWRPEKAWGVGDCLEHLTISAELYVPRITAAIERVRTAGETAGVEPWGRTLLGRFILWGVRNPRKLPAPKIFRPPAAPRDDVLEGFLGVLRQVEGLMREADGLAISRMRMATPVSSLSKLNAGEAFELLTHHALRHLAQARRVVETEGFPEG